MKIQCFCFCRENFKNKSKSSPSPKGPLLMDDSCIHSEMRPRAHLQDVPTLGFGFSAQMQDSLIPETAMLESTGQMLVDEIEEGLPHGYPWSPPCTPPQSVCRRMRLVL